MVLPQGLFRQLLLADSSDREPILSKLFQTELYKRLEEWVKGQARDLRNQMKAYDQQIKAILQTVKCTSREQLVEDYETLTQALVQAKAEKDQCPQQLENQRLRTTRQQTCSGVSALSVNSTSNTRIILLNNLR